MTKKNTHKKKTFVDITWLRAMNGRIEIEIENWLYLFN